MLHDFGFIVDYWILDEIIDFGIYGHDFLHVIKPQFLNGVLVRRLRLYRIIIRVLLDFAVNLSPPLLEIDQLILSPFAQTDAFTFESLRLKLLLIMVPVLNDKRRLNSSCSQCRVDTWK